MSDLKASAFFDEGVMVQTERIILRRSEDSDLMKYIDAFGSSKPLLAKEYRLNETLRQLYWKGVKEDEDPLYCSICDKNNGEFIGYCTVEELNRQPYEVGINLLKSFQAKGFGSEAMAAFISTFQRVSESATFIAKIEPGNVNSQKMFRRIGFVPDSIDAFIIKDFGSLELFEQMRLEELGGIPENLQRLAKEFSVDPRKLLSHVLVFKRPAER